MDYDRKKELLTIDTIKKDVKNILFRNIRGAIILPFILLLIILPPVLLWRNISVSPWIIACVIAIIMWILIGIVVLTFVASLIQLITSIRHLTMVNKNQFTIVTDELVEKTPGRHGGRYTVYKPHVLRFAAYGPYNIPEGRNYKWSKFYDMLARDVFNSSHIGEFFMIVYIAGRKKTIVMVYNTRLFELAE